MRSILRKKVDRCQVELRDDLIDFGGDPAGGGGRTPSSSSSGQARTPLTNITHSVINGDGAWRSSSSSSSRSGADAKKNGGGALWPGGGGAAAAKKTAMMRVKMMR